MPRRRTNGIAPRTDLFDSESFDGFGPSRFHPNEEVPGAHRVRVKSLKDLREKVRAEAPKRPGVYAMLNANGRVIYVGKAKLLRTRLLSYFRIKSRDPKAGRILKHTKTLVWEFAVDELTALLRELELIQLFRPRFNVLGQPGRQRYRYICLGREPAAYAYVTRVTNGKEIACYGPFVGKDRSQNAVRRINEWFLLRDCAAKQLLAFPEQGELFPQVRTPACLRYELGTCLGPCAGLTTRRNYNKATKRARNFLDGNDRSVLDDLAREMKEAATACLYEKAAATRDKLADLQWLDQRLSLLRKSRDQRSFIYPVVGYNNRRIWYVFNRGQVWAVLNEPTDAVSMAKAADMIHLIATSPYATVTGRQSVDSVVLLGAWFRKYSEERLKLRPTNDVIATLRLG